MSRSASGEPPPERFRDVWNRFRESYRFYNHEIAQTTGVSERTVSMWNSGDAEPRGDARRAVVRLVARVDRPTAERIASLLGLAAEIAHLLGDGRAQGPEPDIDPGTVAGDVYLAAEESGIAPRTLLDLQHVLVRHWHARRWSLAQVAKALEQLAKTKRSSAT